MDNRLRCSGCSNAHIAICFTFSRHRVPCPRCGPLGRRASCLEDSGTDRDQLRGVSGPV